jgi:hypothetical protein
MIRALVMATSCANAMRGATSAATASPAATTNVLMDVTSWMMPARVPFRRERPQDAITRERRK